MKLNKKARLMVYDIAIGVQKSRPHLSVHSCLEESFILCAGFSQYNQRLESMLIEYRENKNSSIAEMKEMLINKNKRFPLITHK